MLLRHWLRSLNGARWGMGHCTSAHDSRAPTTRAPRACHAARTRINDQPSKAHKPQAPENALPHGPSAAARGTMNRQVGLRGLNHRTRYRAHPPAHLCVNNPLTRWRPRRPETPAPRAPRPSAASRQRDHEDGEYPHHSQRSTAARHPDSSIPTGGCRSPCTIPRRERRRAGTRIRRRAHGRHERPSAPFGPIRRHRWHWRRPGLGWHGGHPHTSGPGPTRRQHRLQGDGGGEEPGGRPCSLAVGALAAAGAADDGRATQKGQTRPPRPSRRRRGAARPWQWRRRPPRGGPRGGAAPWRPPQGARQRCPTSRRPLSPRRMSDGHADDMMRSVAWSHHQLHSNRVAAIQPSHKVHRVRPYMESNRRSWSGAARACHPALRMVAASQPHARR